MSAADAADGIGRGLARTLAASRHEPPVLVVAHPDAVGRFAPAWLESFDEAGWVYRVRSFGGAAPEHEIAALAAEAGSLGAKTIAAIGDAELVAACKAVAQQAEIAWFGSR